MNSIESDRKGVTMEIKKLSDEVSVSPQIGVDELTEISSAGFRSIICNRPDGESTDQAAFAAIRMRADNSGLVTRHIPIVSGQMNGGDVLAFSEALNELPKPVLAYCRTGMRSANALGNFTKEQHARDGNFAACSHCGL